MAFGHIHWRSTMNEINLNEFTKKIVRETKESKELTQAISALTLKMMLQMFLKLPPQK